MPPFLIRMVLGLLVIGSLVWFLLPRKASAPEGSAPEKTAKAPGVSQLLTQFNLEGFDSKGDLYWKLDGQEATIGREGNIFIERDARLVVQEKTVVETDKVHWDNATQTLVTQEPVTITHQGLKIRGRGAYGKLKEEFMQINKDIEVELDRGSTLIARGPMKIFGASGVVSFYRDVVITDADGTVKSQEVQILFDKQTRQAQKAYARKDVEIDRQGDKAYSDVAVYDIKTKSVKLLGSPKIYAQEEHVKDKIPSMPAPAGIQ